MGPGDDELYGGSHNDYLYGGDHNDSLYGGDGLDQLFGEAGHDGLYGGAGLDGLDGGSGADRFLIDTLTPLSDSIQGESVIDVVVSFVAGENTIHDGTAYLGQQWTGREIENIDRSLRVLHHHQGGKTGLLRTASGSQITFVRRGTPLTSSSVLAWNSGTHITVLDSAFSANVPLEQTVFHEIGHLWDNETIFWNGFKEMSKWKPLAIFYTPPSGYTRATKSDGTPQPWIYKTGSAFARTYGSTSPYEDFATCFAALFMQEAGWSYVGGSGGANVGDKIKFIDQFIV